MTVPNDADQDAPRGILAGRPLLRNAGALTLSRGVTLVTGLIVTAWLGRTLGPAQYGMIGFAGAIVAYFAFAVGLGLDVLGTRDVARFPRRTRTVASHIFTFRLALAAASLAALALFVALVDQPPMAKLVLAVHGLWLISVAFNLDFVYQGRARMTVIAGREIVVSLLTLAGVLLFVRGPGDTVVAASILMGSMLAGAILVFARCRRDYAAPVLRFDPRLWKGMAAAAVPIAAVAMTVTFYRNLDTAMLGFLRLPAEVGQYTAAFKFFTTGLAPAMILLAAFTPRLSACWGRPDEVRTTMADFVGAVAALIAPVAAFGFVFAPELVTVLFGDAYAPSVPAMRFLMVALFFAALNVSYSHPLMLWNRQRSVLPPLALATALNFALNLALIPAWGIEGAAAATALTEISLIFWFAALQRRAGGSLALSRIAVHLLAAAAAAALGRWVADAGGGEGFPSGVLERLAVGAAAGGIVYAAVVAPLWWRRLFVGRAIAGKGRR